MTQKSGKLKKSPKPSPRRDSGRPRSQPAPELSREDIDCFQALVKSVELAGVHLMNTTASLHVDNVDPAGPPENLALQVDPAQVRAAVRTAPNSAPLLSCGVRFRLSERVGSKKTTQTSSVIDILAEYTVFYRIPGNIKCTEGGLALFAGRNAVFNAWPFFRELSSSLVNRMGFPSVVLPLLRMPVRPPTG